MSGYNQKSETCSLTTSVAMSTPPVRMLVVQVEVERNEDGTWAKSAHYHPVLALIARQTVIYYRDRNSWVKNPHRRGVTHEEMVMLGWTHFGTAPTLYFDALIHDTVEGGLIDAEGDFGGTCNYAYEIISAPWPPEEDATRVAKIVEKLTAYARDNVVRDEEHQKAKEAQ